MTDDIDDEWWWWGNDDGGDSGRCDHDCNEVDYHKDTQNKTKQNINNMLKILCNSVEAQLKRL